MPSGMAFLVVGSFLFSHDLYPGTTRSLLFWASSLLQLAGPISILHSDHIFTRHYNNIGHSIAMYSGLRILARSG